MIGIAVVRAMANYVRQLFARATAQMDATESIRLQLGRALALGGVE